MSNTTEHIIRYKYQNETDRTFVKCTCGWADTWYGDEDEITEVMQLHQKHKNCQHSNCPWR